MWFAASVGHAASSTIDIHWDQGYTVDVVGSVTSGNNPIDSVVGGYYAFNYLSGWNFVDGAVGRWNYLNTGLVAFGDDHIVSASATVRGQSSSYADFGRNAVLTLGAGSSAAYRIPFDFELDSSTRTYSFTSSSFHVSGSCASLLGASGCSSAYAASIVGFPEYSVSNDGQLQRGAGYILIAATNTGLGTEVISLTTRVSVGAVSLVQEPGQRVLLLSGMLLFAVLSVTRRKNRL